MKSLVLALAAVGLIGTSAHTIQAADVNVPNYSFENPQPPYPGGLPVSLTITDWTTNGPASERTGLGFNFPPGLNPGVGIYQNTPGTSPFITNADPQPAPNQLAYMFSNSTHTLSQLLSTTYQANQTYQLTVGVADAGAIPSTGDTLSIQLYYTTDPTDADPTQRVFLATRNVVQGTDSLSQTSLTDYSASFTTPSGTGVPVGKDIGIIFTTTGVGGGEFDLDKVRLTATPEPASLSLMAAFATLGLLRRRR